jgi:hypothetical protein
MDPTATLIRLRGRSQTNAAPPKSKSSSPADESVRLADKGSLDPPMLDGVASPFLLSLPLLPSPAPTQTSCAASPSLFSSASPPRASPPSRKKTTARSASASSSTPMARARFTKATRPIAKPLPLPQARMAKSARKFDGIWMRTDGFFVAKFLGQRNNFDLSCKTNTTGATISSKKLILPKTKASSARSFFATTPPGIRSVTRPTMVPGNFSAKPSRQLPHRQKESKAIKFQTEKQRRKIEVDRPLHGRCQTTSSSPRDESVRLADKRLLDPPRASNASKTLASCPKGY